jgi:uncharacterized SAM-binding protein YcdF (DUF218 family)
VESEIMGLYAMELGVPQQNIFYESKAEHSVENLYYSYVLAKKSGFKNIAVATDPFQDKMMKAFKRKWKLEVRNLPIVFSMLTTQPMPDPQINPASAFVENFVSLTERKNFRQRFRGTRGKNIKWDHSVK